MLLGVLREWLGVEICHFAFPFIGAKSKIENGRKVKSPSLTPKLYPNSIFTIYLLRRKKTPKKFKKVKKSNFFAIFI